MRNIKLTIEYDGTNFSGWQTQPLSQRTVQLETLNVLKKLCKENVVLVEGHALGELTSGSI